LYVLHFGSGSSVKSFPKPSSANIGNYSAGESSRAKEAPKSIILEDVLISFHPSKSKEALQKKDGISKSLLPNLEE
jgi:hypothetical protein